MPVMDLVFLLDVQAGNNAFGSANFATMKSFMNAVIEG